MAPNDKEQFCFKLSRISFAKSFQRPCRSPNASFWHSFSQILVGMRETNALKQALLSFLDPRYVAASLAINPKSSDACHSCHIDHIVKEKEDKKEEEWKGHTRLGWAVVFLRQIRLFLIQPNDPIVSAVRSASRKGRRKHLDQLNIVRWKFSCFRPAPSSTLLGKA